MQTNDPVKRQEIRQQSKKNGEIAATIAKDFIASVIETDEDAQQAQTNLISNIVRDIVFETSEELTGSKCLERQMKKSVQFAQ